MNSLIFTILFIATQLSLFCRAEKRTVGPFTYDVALSPLDKFEGIYSWLSLSHTSFASGQANDVIIADSSEEMKEAYGAAHTAMLDKGLGSVKTALEVRNMLGRVVRAQCSSGKSDQGPGASGGQWEEVIGKENAEMIKRGVQVAKDMTVSAADLNEECVGRVVKIAVIRAQEIHTNACGDRDECKLAIFKFFWLLSWGMSVTTMAVLAISAIVILIVLWIIIRTIF